MGKSFDKLLEIAQKIKNNELPESNTNTLVGGHLMDIIEKCSEAVDLINENKVETDGKITQVEQSVSEFDDVKSIILGTSTDLVPANSRLDTNTTITSNSAGEWAVLGNISLSKVDNAFRIECIGDGHG